MKYTIISLILFCSLFLSAEIIWESDFGSFGADYAQVKPSIALCEDGSFVLIGTLSFDIGGGCFDTIGYIIKIGENGNLLWTSSESYNIYEYGVHPYGIIETNNGDLITAGMIMYTGYVIKRDSDGEKLWEIGFTDFNIKNIIKLDTTSFAVIGSLNDSDLSAIRKFDNSGNTIWTKEFQMGATWSWLLNGISTSDNCFTFIGSRYYDWSSSDSFTLKVNTSGDSLWSQINNDNFSKWMFESSTNELIVLSSEEIIKLDLNGNIISTVEGDYDYGIDLPNENNFLARNDEYGSPQIFDIFKFDYDLNNLWSTDEYFRFYFKKLQDEGFLFYCDYSFHIIRTNEEFVSVSNGIIPEACYNLSNFPNPFNPSTTIEFSIQNDSQIEISIYSIKGQKTKTLVHNGFTKGSHSIIWNGDDDFGNSVSSGIYLYKLKVNGKTEVVRKSLLLK
jgi:hypothetical protein